MIPYAAYSSRREAHISDQQGRPAGQIPADLIPLAQ